MKISLPRTAGAATVFICLAVCLVTATPAPPSDLDVYVARAMKEFEVPGLALAIVKDGQLELAKGYGVRKLGSPEKVDEFTLFGIASNTKAFTATAIGLLADRKKLSWDDPVQKHLPGFVLYDPYVSKEIMVRDLLCHRSGLGLGAGDLLFWPDTTRRRDEVVYLARFLRPASGFRSRYAYNNLMFVIAGELIHSVSGQTYDQFVTESLFQPLEMKSTRITNRGLPPDANLAEPHSKGWRLDGPLVPVPYTLDHTWAAAAGIRSNVLDLSRWVAAHLRRGKRPDGAGLWSDAVARELWQMHTPIRPSEPPESLRAARSAFSGYALGWSLRDFQGHKVVSHGGSLVGMVTTVAMMPDLSLGVIILTNQEESGAYTSVFYHILEHYLHSPSTDWISAFRSIRTESIQKAWDAEKKETEQRNRNSRPSLAWEDYAGEYSDPWYGRVVLSLESGRLLLKMANSPALQADLEHWQYDTFRAVFRDRTVPDAFLTFHLNPQGKVENLKMSACSTLADFSFDYQDLDLRPVSK